MFNINTNNGYLVIIEVTKIAPVDDGVLPLDYNTIFTSTLYLRVFVVVPAVIGGGGGGTHWLWC